MLALGERLKRVSVLGPLGTAGASKAASDKDKLTAASGGYQQEIYSYPGENKQMPIIGKRNRNKTKYRCHNRNTRRICMFYTFFGYS